MGGRYEGRAAILVHGHAPGTARRQLALYQQHRWLLDLVQRPSGIGPESLETQLYAEAEIPWPEVAFLSVEFALRRYLEDRRAGVERVHFRTIDWRDGKLVTTDG